ncbi:MAG: hypothetical protein ACOC30_01260, partial [Marinilabilia sp.]
ISRSKPLQSLRNLWRGKRNGFLRERQGKTAGTSQIKNPLLTFLLFLQRNFAPAVKNEKDV